MLCHFVFINKLTCGYICFMSRKSDKNDRYLVVFEASCGQSQVFVQNIMYVGTLQVSIIVIIKILKNVEGIAYAYLDWSKP